MTTITIEIGGRMSIQEAFALAVDKENAEMLEFPDLGMVFLRSKLMPSHAFLVWSVMGTTTYSQIAFKMPQWPFHGYSQQYSVVCACCWEASVGDLGKLPKQLRGQGAVVQEYDVRFKRRLEYFCRKYRIRHLFLRRAEEWGGRFGQMVGIEVSEAFRHIETLKFDYGTRVIELGLRFINYRHSHGISNRE